MKDFKLPPILENVFRDLRDKRLLPVAIVLVAAIVAVPFLLGSSAPPQPSADVTAAQSSDLAEEPVVLTDAPGLRNYRKRLNQFKKANPFKQQLTAAPTSEKEAGELEDPFTADGGGGGGGSDPVTDALGGLEGTGGDPVSNGDSGEGDLPGGPPSNPGNGGKGRGDGGGGDGESVFYSVDVDVRFGPAGNTRKYKGLVDFDLISERKPVLQYLGGRLDASKAFFAVSDRVVEVLGDGNCSPAPGNCDFLSLEVGDEVRFVYGGDARVYRMRLDSIDVKAHKVKKLPQPERRVAGDSAARATP